MFFKIPSFALLGLNAHPSSLPPVIHVYAISMVLDCNPLLYAFDPSHSDARAHQMLLVGMMLQRLHSVGLWPGNRDIRIHVSKMEYVNCIPVVCILFICIYIYVCILYLYVYNCVYILYHNIIIL